MISESHSVPKNTSITWLISLPISIFADDILNRIQLWSTMICIDHSLSPSYLSLFFSIHNMIRMYPIIIVAIPRWLLIQIIYSLPVLVYHDLVVVIIGTSVVLSGGGASGCFGWVLGSWSWSTDFITLDVLLLLLVVLLLVLGVALTCVFSSASLFCFVVFSLLVCAILLEVWLLKRHTIIIKHNLFIRTAPRIILSILLISLTKPLLRRDLLRFHWHLASNFLLTGSISHLSIVMLIFNFLETFISYAWFRYLFWDLAFTIFYWFLGVVCSAVVGLGCRS